MHSPLSRRLILLAGLGLALACGLLYQSTAGFQFTNLDDDIYVAANPDLEQGPGLQGLRWAFTTTRGDIWMPVTWVSYLIDHGLFGSAPAGFHRANILWHTLATLLLFLWLVRATGRVGPAAAMGLLFAVHPLHVESVAWVASRKDLVSAVFFLASLHAHLSWRRQGQGRFYLGALLAFAAAVMAKPLTVTLPAILILVDWWLDLPTPSPRRRALELAPFAAVAGAAITVTYILAAGAESTLVDTTGPIGRLGRAAVLLLTYLQQTLRPHDLIVHHPRADLDYPGWLQGLAAGGVLAVSTAVWAARRRARWAAAGWVWFVITLAPALGLLRAGNQLLADRYMYLPLAGLLIMAACGIDTVARQRHRLRLPSLLLAVTATAFLTLAASRQVGVWRDSESLFTHALAVSPDSHLAHLNLGVYLDDQGRSAEALPHLRRALDLHPDALHRFNLANALMHLQRYPEAIPLYRTVVAQQPEFAEALNNLGVCLASTGDATGGERFLRRAIATRADYAPAHFNLGLVLDATGRRQEAVQEFRRTLQLDPRHEGARRMLESGK